jgi:carboxyl-terminal processing protease
MMSIKKINIKIVLLIVIAFTFGFTLSDSDYFFKVNKSIDVFGRVYKELTLNYVDEIDPEVFMKAGVDGMLKSLDPYTNFITSSEASDVELITTGKYGGIGISIGMREGMIIITSLMEGYTAQRQGLRIGDQILDVNGKSLENVKLEDIRHLTRGEPGTEVKLKVKREGDPKSLDFVLIREEIKLKNISYADFVKDGIALIRLDRFTRSAGDELRLAVKELKLKGEIKGIILDVRDNPGGLLEAAVDVVSKFVPKGSLIVSTKGRRLESENKFLSVEEPMLKDIPLAILVNQNSASASEIVSGSIQDLDRGVIVGTKTFGKGLVQNIIPLVYDNQLKMTTAKYYTPSGRCIQEIDYIHKSKDGLFTITPDSLRKEYVTKNLRKVYESGGIQPDTTVSDLDPSVLFVELLRKAMFFKFANYYVAVHKELPQDFSVNGELCKQFKEYVDKESFTYEDEAETKIDEVIKFSEKSKYSTELIDEIKALKNKFTSIKDKGFETNKKELANALRQEIISRYKGEKGRFEATFDGDKQVQTALGLLQNSVRYKKILNNF